MKELHVVKTAMVFGVFLGAFHLAWSLLVFLSLAQPLLNFIFWAHMISNPYQITGFTLIQSATLIVVTSGVGYVAGWVFASIWNMMHK